MSKYKQKMEALTLEIAQMRKEIKSDDERAIDAKKDIEHLQDELKLLANRRIRWVRHVDLLEKELAAM